MRWPARVLSPPTHLGWNHGTLVSGVGLPLPTVRVLAAPASPSWLQLPPLPGSPWPCLVWPYSQPFPYPSLVPSPGCLPDPASPIPVHPVNILSFTQRAEVRPARALHLPFRPFSGLLAFLGRNPIPGTGEAPERAKKHLIQRFLQSLFSQELPVWFCPTL